MFTTHPPLQSVHFLCKHSFNARKLEEEHDEYGRKKWSCPLCAPENRRIRNIQRQLEEKGRKQNAFKEELERAPDGFELVCDYLGKGIFGSSSLAK